MQEVSLFCIATRHFESGTPPLPISYPTTIINQFLTVPGHRSLRDVIVEFLCCVSMLYSILYKIQLGVSRASWTVFLCRFR